MHQTLRKRFYYIGMAEGVSFLLLLGIAMPLKYWANIPQAVSIVGMAHGVLFMAYLYLAFECWQTLGWSFKKFVLAGISSVLPFGPFWFHKKHA